MQNLITVNVDTQLITPEQKSLLALAVGRIQDTAAANTVKKYLPNFKVFIAFCVENGFEFLPAHPDTIEIYQKHLAEICKYSPATIQQHLAAIATFHSSVDLTNPVQKRVQKKVTKLKKEQPQHQAKPALSSPLYDAIDKIDTNTNKGKRDKALLLVGVVGCFRRSELAGIKVQDCVFTPKGLQVTIYGSKTDKTGDGVIKAIEPNNVNRKYCPVKAVQDWLLVAQPDTYLFATVTKYDTIQTNKPLDGQAVNRIVKSHLGNEFSGHSLRVGFAVQAYENGASGLQIQKQGGWASDAMVKRYTEASDIWANNASSFFYK